MAKLAAPPITDSSLCSTCILLPKDQLPGDRVCVFCAFPPTPRTQLGLLGALKRLLSLITVSSSWVLKTYALPSG